MLALLLAVPLALDPRPPLRRRTSRSKARSSTRAAPRWQRARVVAISIDQRLTPSTQTDGQGEFELLLAPGTYSVRVTAPRLPAGRAERDRPRHGAATAASSC